jgi:hypothetical protein
MAGKRETNPAGSTNTFRGDVLRVLGALKVATTDQIQRIGAPHLSYRHTDKPTPAKQKQARTASHTGALSDMRKHGLVENGGSTETGDRLRNLTPKGLQAASYELQRPVTEMGSTARGADSSGASHPMAVNETVIAMLRPKAEPRQAHQGAGRSPGSRPGRRRRAARHRHHRLVLDRGTAARHRHVERARQGRRPGRHRPHRPAGRGPAAVHRGRELPRDRGGARRQAGEVRPVLPAEGEGHRRT